MKETKKSYFYSNKKLMPEPYHIAQDELSICEIKNLTTENGIIEQNKSLVNFYLTKFPSIGEYLKFEAKYHDTLKLIDQIIAYEYYDLGDDKFYTRYIATGTDLKIYQINFDKQRISQFSPELKQKPKIRVFHNKLYIDDNSGTFIIFSKGSYPIEAKAETYATIFEYYRGLLLYTQKDFPMRIYGKYNLSGPEDVSIHPMDADYYMLDLGDGDILGIYNFNNNAYVVQNYLISKINNSTDALKYIPSYASNSRIIPGTLQVHEDRLYFMTENGFCYYDGNSAKYLFPEILKNIVGVKKGVVFNGKYYLATHYKFESGEKSALLEFNLSTNFCNILTLDDTFGDIDDVFVLKTTTENCLCIHHNHPTAACKIYTLIQSESDKLTEKYIEFSPIAFNSYYLKELNHIKLTATGTFNIKIETDYSSTTFKADGNIDLKNLGIKGNTFKFVFWETDPFKISSMYLNVGFLEE